MTTKVKVLHYLLDHQDKTVSGRLMAEAIGVSRNAIWKVIKDFQASGYEIVSIPGQGYQLQKLNQAIDPLLISYFLGADYPLVIEYHNQVTSTNDIARQALLNNPKQSILVIADEQTAGRGRRGRNFFSNLSQGLYYSLGIQPHSEKVEDIPIYTLMTASALIEALQTYLDEKILVKWVNDLFYQGKKVTGILSEMVTHLENNEVPSIVIGIGLNLSGNFSQADPEIRRVAGTFFGDKIPDSFNVNQFLANFIKIFMDYQKALPEKHFLDTYKAHMMGLNKKVSYTLSGQSRQGLIRGINDQGHLLVENKLGQVEPLYGQDVHFSSGQFLNQN